MMQMFKRKDGDLVEEVHPIRRMMPFLMPTRTESFVLYKQRLDATRAKAFLKEINAARPADRRVTGFHLLLRAISRVVQERPRLNRFLVAGRLYQRRGTWIAFSAKQSMDDDAPVFTCKREFPADEGLLEMVDSLCELVAEGRSGKESATDREIRFLLRLPAPLLRLAVGAAGLLNRWNLLPHSMIEVDPMFSTVFVTNLGSLGLDACYHHNFEHGTCPLFLVMGRPREVPVVSDGREVGVAETFEIKYTYDERVEDGFYCVAALERIRYFFEEAPKDLL